MRKPGSKGAPTAKQFKRAAKTAKKKAKDMASKKDPRLARAGVSGL